MEDCKLAPTLMETGVKLSTNDEEKPVDGTLFRQLVGSLIYLTTTRLDITFAVGVISKYMTSPKQNHWKAAKRILRYLRGTLQFGLEYMHTGNFRLQGYADSDWAGCIDSWKSTFGYCFSLGSVAVSWSSKKQPNVALSSTEAEYKVAVIAACEKIWLRRILADIGLHQEEATKLFCDNQSVLKIAKNLVFHAQTKHIEVHHHFIKEQI